MQLQASGLRIIACTEKAGKTLHEVDLTGPVAFVMGSEEDGIDPALLEVADERVSIPMAGSTGSLNVSVATGIILFERLRQVRAHG
jgi:23S rRNA (guanosine2251-2'-O)-methyltransferase